jgi:tetratricopeptide (TPR) repeat protein
VDKKLRIYDQMCDAIIRLPGNPHILDYIKEDQAYAEHKTDENLLPYKERINIAFVLYIDKEIEKAVTLKKNTFKDGWLDNARDWNTFSWWCFEHQINLEEAEKLARRDVRLAESGPQKASILDTQAEIVFLQGDKQQALTLIKEAIKENPESVLLLRLMRNLSLGLKWPLMQQMGNI